MTILDVYYVTQSLYQFFLSPFSKCNHKPYHWSVDTSPHTCRLFVGISALPCPLPLVSLCKVSGNLVEAEDWQKLIKKSAQSVIIGCWCAHYLSTHFSISSNQPPAWCLQERATDCISHSVCIQNADEAKIYLFWTHHSSALFWHRNNLEQKLSVWQKKKLHRLL